jgi:hypothetical protein
MMSGMNRRILLGLAGWLTVAVAATTAATAAIDVLEDGITGRSVRPLDDEAVHRALSRTGVSPAPGTPGTTPSPPAGGVSRNLVTTGGTIIARCEGAQVTVLAAMPAQGYGTDDVEHGPASSLSVTFESDTAEYDVTVTCSGGRPVARTAADDGGGDRRRGRDGDGGGGRGRHGR